MNKTFRLTLMIIVNTKFVQNMQNKSVILQMELYYHKFYFLLPLFLCLQYLLYFNQVSSNVECTIL